MKKLLIFCFLSILVSHSSYSQCDFPTNTDPVARGALAIFIFDELYIDNNTVTDYEAAYFPNPFIDLQDNNDLFLKIRTLSYLQYNNGLTVYNFANELSVCFKPFSAITKTEALIYVMEAWNIIPDYSGSSYFNDIPTGSIFHGFANKALDEGLIDGGTNFNLAEIFTIEAARELICRVKQTSFHPVSEDLTDIDNYFTPGMYNPTNLSQAQGLSQGVFNHYAKNSFVIPDVKLNLNFSHFYSSTMIELPKSFYAIKPLGRGWSHTYNAYVTREDNVGPDNIDYYYIVWPDGMIHIYNEDDSNYESIGVYDEFDELSSGDRLRIIKKDQTRFYFEKLDNDRDIWYLNEIRDPNGNETNIDYESAEEDDTKRIESVEAPSGKKLFFEYDNNTDYLEKITDPIGREIEFDVDDGRFEEFTDAKGNDTKYRYVENNNAPFQDLRRRFLLDEIKLPRGNEIKAEYDENNAKLSSYQVNNDDPTEINVDFDYENDTRTTEVETPIPGTSSNFTQDYTFNSNGLVTNYQSDRDNLVVEYPTSVTNISLPDNSTLNGVYVEYDYDNDGNVTKIDKEDGEVIEEFEYDNDNNLTQHTDANGNITDFSYDSDENLIQIDDAEGGTTVFTYDNFGQLISTTNQEGITINYTYQDGVVSSVNAPEGIQSTYIYDDINRLEQSNNNGLISQYNYDPNDNVTNFINSGGFTTSYDYDANDNLTTITNANDINTAFTYDDEDRVVEEKFGNLIKEYEYGDEGYLEEYTKPSGTQIEYDYDSDGRLKEKGTITDIDYNNRNLVDDITNSTGTVAFDYDNLNRVEEVTTVHDLKVDYDYEDSGHLEEIQYPTINGLQVKVEYNYDNKNRVTQVVLNTNNASNNTIIAEFDYKDDDRVDDFDYANGTHTAYFYDDAGRLDNMFITGADNSVIYQNEMTLDNRGNIIKEVQSFQPIPPGNNPNSSTNDIEYNYDDNNHILDADGVNYNVNDDGNTTVIGGATALTYDVDNRLNTYNKVDNNLTFKYNAYNQRVEVNRNGTITKYVRDVMRDNILVEMDASNSPIYYYIYSTNGMLLARMKSNGNLQYYHGDIRGSTVMMTDENASITHQYRYDDFGQITKTLEPNNDTNRFRYVGTFGVEYDLNDLYYMHARYYQSSVGRFLTEDPIWSTNLYPYADNNPISKIDPKGESSIFADGYLTTLFDYYGYGVKANELSQKHSAVDIAISNPEISGFAIGALVTTAAVTGYGGVQAFGNALSASTTSATLFQTAVGSVSIHSVNEIISGIPNALNIVNDVQNGVPGSEKELANLIFSTYSPNFVGGETKQLMAEILLIIRGELLKQ